MKQIPLRESGTGHSYKYDFARISCLSPPPRVDCHVFNCMCPWDDDRLYRLDMCPFKLIPGYE